MVTGTEVFTRRSRTPGGARRCPTWTGYRAAVGLPRRLDVHDPGRRDAGLPRLAHQPARGARRDVDPAEPARAAAGRRRRRELLGAGRTAARPRPHRGAGPGSGGSTSSRSVSTAGGSTPPGRRTSCRARRHRGRRHRPGGRVEPHPVARRRPPRSCSGPPGWCPRCAAPGCCGTRSGCGRCARPSALERAGDVVHCYGHGGAGVTLSGGARTRSCRWSRPRGARPGGRLSARRRRGRARRRCVETSRRRRREPPRRQAR